MNKFLILSENNHIVIDAIDLNDAKQMLKKSLNKNNKNQVFEIINLFDGNKKILLSK